MTSVSTQFNTAHDRPPRLPTVNEWIVEGLSNTAAPALVFKGETLGRDVLRRWVNAMAAELISQGVKEGDRVGVCLDRSFEMIATILGILKLGAAYVPLDPNYPKDRLEMMRSDARLHLTIAHAKRAEGFVGDEILIWEDLSTAVSHGSHAEVEVEVTPDHIAYVIFTSGSTGRPKGIEMPHRALANLIEWQLERSSFKHGARVAQYSSISFDVSFQEIATTLASGGTLCLMDDETRRDPRGLLDALIHDEVERLFLPYVAFRSLVEAAAAKGLRPPKLKEVITAGEQLRIDPPTRAFFAMIDGSTLDNQYGPSETHVITARLLSGDPAEWPDLPDIGFPLTNCGACVLDDQLAFVAEGQEGELYLSGRNIAKGYINQPERTAEVFLANPHDVEDRPVLYKTGDRVSIADDGSLVFHGRADDQVKIRGHRVEPAEVDNAAAAYSGLGKSVSRAIEGTDHIHRLATYFTSTSGETLDVRSLRSYLAEKLPAHMVPAFLVQVNELPTTPSGKIDFKNLPDPTIANTRFADHAVDYSTETEVRLAEIWSRLLGLSAIPPTADFFELGGDSLRAVTLFLEIDRVFGRELPLATLTKASSLSGLAAEIDGGGTGPDFSAFRSLQCLQTGRKDATPLYMVHGGQGNVLVFADLVRHLLEEQPVYAFQWAGWDGGRGPEDVKEMARAYLDELLRHHSGGPIRLGGFCIGGLVALELADLARNTDLEIVDPLIICDSPNLASKNYRESEPWDDANSITEFERLEERLAALMVRGDIEFPRANYTPPTGKAALMRAIPGVMPLLRALKSHRDDGGDRTLWKRSMDTLAAGQKVPMDDRADYCRISLVRAAKRHRGTQYGGDVVYFRSNSLIGRAFALKGWWTDPTLGFQELCAGTFDARAVGGSHADVMNEDALVRAISELLAR